MTVSASSLKGTIVLVPFPFDDFTSLKMRPALCLTDVVGGYEHVIVAFISSRIPESLLETDVVIKKVSEDWQETGLKVDSVIKLHKKVTIPRAAFTKKLGTISFATRNSVVEKLRRLFFD